MCEIGAGDVLLDVLPIEHNLPLGCPGMQGFLLTGGTVVLGASTRPRDIFELIQRHRVTHIQLVPALLIRLIDDPSIDRARPSSLRLIQSGGQRLQPEVRLRAERAHPGCFMQENFGMSEGLLMFVAVDRPAAACGWRRSAARVCPTTRCTWSTRTTTWSRRRGRRAVVRGPYTLRGYFRRARAQRRGPSPRTASTAPAT